MAQRVLSGAKLVVRRLKKAMRVSFSKFIWYNYFSRNVERRGKGFLIPYRHAVLDLKKSAKIILHDGHFFVNAHLPAHSRMEAYVRMGEGAVLEIAGTVSLYYRATIEIKKDAVISIGSGYFNSNAVILAAERITIGNGVAVAREVFIYDADHHPVLDGNGNQTNSPQPIVIGDHVWIGVKCTLLRGSKIGAGAVVGANSLVRGEIQSGTLAYGNPARSHSEIRWDP